MHAGTNITEGYARPFHPRPSYTAACISRGFCYREPHLVETLQGFLNDALDRISLCRFFLSPYFGFGRVVLDVYVLRGNSFL